MNEAVKNQSNRVMTTTFDEKEKKLVNSQIQM